MYFSKSVFCTLFQLEELQYVPPTFDLYSNNIFLQRHMALSRFVQAARKIVVRLRCQSRLEKLRPVVNGLKAGKSIRASLGEITVLRIHRTGWV
jgi:hypothetical protein